MDERDFYLAFSCAPGIGPQRLALLLKKFGTAEKAWEAAEKDFRLDGIGDKIFSDFDSFRKKYNFELCFKSLVQKNIWFVALCDKGYPQGLKKLSNPPIVIFGKGDKSCFATDKTLGVVGTRKVTSYGKEVTESLVTQLTDFGFTIISGMALGIDAIAHNSCLDNGGKTIAVLGNGVDLPFPRENLGLYNKILEKGGAVISEYPPSTNPTRGSFPARNRIISALSLGVLVTEASEDSGSLITAEYAKRLEKPVFAVPGPITSSMSDGTSKLLKEKATLVSSVKDIIEVLNVKTQNSKIKTTTQKFKNLSNDEKTIVSLLQNEEITIDELVRKSKIATGVLFGIISSLEIQRIVKNSGGKISLVNL